MYYSALWELAEDGLRRRKGGPRKVLVVREDEGGKHVRRQTFHQRADIRQLGLLR